MVKKKAEAQASKKNLQKKKQSQVEDKTFGLKNKNKSKKVQGFVKSVEKSVMNSGDPRTRKLEEQRTAAKAERKAKSKALKVEQEALFGEALLAVSKKKSLNQKDGKVEAQGRDGNDEATKKSTSRAMKMMFQMDAAEMDEKLREDPNYVPTLEDEIEMQRQKKVEELKKSGKGTPITPESFAIWQDRKRKIRAEEVRKKVQIELRKKKGGKGLSILSGRDLYEYKKELFADRDDDRIEEEEEDADMKQSAATANGETEENGTEETAQVTAKLQSNLFLEGDDDDLDDLEDD